MIINNKDIIIISHSTKGIKRSKNQDDTLVIQHENFFLFFLFDGVSSYPNSYKIIRLCKKFIKKNYIDFISETFDLAGLVYAAHLFVLSHYLDMTIGCTTCSAVWLDRKKKDGYFLNIGDSRIYEYSNQYLEQMTKDDHLQGNSRVLTKCLGTHGMNKSDFIQSPMMLKHGMLLCSDGFYELMERDLKRYFSIFNFKRRMTILKSLIALQKGKNIDDSTFLIIKHGI